MLLRLRPSRLLPPLVALLLATAWVALPAAAAPGARALANSAAGPRVLAAPAAGPRVAARAGVLMDAGSRAVLWQREAHRAVLVASTTKILTALVAHDTYPAGKVFTVPRAAEDVDGTRFGYQRGMRVKRHDLLTTLLLVSANDAAETLAGAYPRGGRAGFLAAMQAEAASFGCTDSTWRDPSGLDAPGHQASAADLAILGRALLGKPELAKIVGTAWTRYRWPGGRVQIINNHNHFVSRGQDKGALGIKTGYTVRARSTIVAAQRRGGRTLIAVALGSDDMYGDVRSMFSYGFATRAPAGAEVLGRTPVGAASSVGPTQLDQSGSARFESGRPDQLPPGPRSLLPRLVAAPLPALIAGAVGLLTLGTVVTVLSRSRRA